MNTNISELSRNRAEEYGEDLWQEFVIPPYYQKLELLQSSKPSVIEGGRGCGKTMLLRYLCHDTQFSKNRSKFDDSSLNRIGVYWKMDTQFANVMFGRGIDREDWICAFVHMVVLVISREILKSLNNISYHNELLAEDRIESLNFSILSAFDSQVPASFSELELFLHKKFIEFQEWVSNVRTQRPTFYALSFISEIIEVIKKQLPEFHDTTFHIYIDEYENLLGIQKQIVNTWMKHSQPPLIFNIAMKHNAFDVRETLGTEKLVDIHDFRLFDIEELLNANFNTFASEIFLLKLKRIGYQTSVIDESTLFDISDSAIESRLQREYQKNVQAVVSFLFPKYTSEEIARLMLDDETLSRNIQNEIKEQLQRRSSKVKFKSLYDTDYPRAVVIIPSLLNRPKLSAEVIEKEFRKFKKGEDSKFTDWIQNNFVGCSLYWYGKYNRICPIYAGDSAFRTMAKGNIRHFLELCSASLAQNAFKSEIKPVTQDKQAIAVKNVSAKMLKEIKSLGNSGNVLYDFSIRLGSVFENARQRISQSEPEQNHFSLSDTLSEKSQWLLNELVKWSVLYEYKLTKQKALETGFEYLLNPIYASFFTISYRKKRRITLSNKDIETIAFGEAKEFERYLRDRSKHDYSDDDYLSLF